MTEGRLPTDDPWFWATWEGASLASLLAGARLSLPEKLAWLEEVTEMGERMRARAEPLAGPDLERTACGED